MSSYNVESFGSPLKTPPLMEPIWFPERSLRWKKRVVPIEDPLSCSCVISFSLHSLFETSGNY